MARSRNSRRSRGTARAARGSGRVKSPPRRRLAPFLGRIVAFARPRSAGEVLALTLTLLGLATLAALVIPSVLKDRTVGAEIGWCLVLLIGAGAARLEPWWQEKVTAFTWNTARVYLGILVLCYAAASVCWHLVSRELGLGLEYPLPGPASSGEWGLAATVALGVIGAAQLTGIPVRQGVSSVAKRATGIVDSWRTQRVLARAHVELGEALPSLEVDEVAAEPELDPRPPTTDQESAPPSPAEPPPQPAKPSLPPIDIFAPAPRGRAAPLDIELTSQRIEETLRSFNVGARVVGHHVGPVVTQFDLEPERGVKVRRITELHNDLALALAAPSIRIQAPVPGKPFVGVEIPNTAASVVGVREILESEAYRSIASPLRVALGKDVAGNGAVIDLAKMPHLLIAGATGSGKSVCVNAIISCLLFQNTPDEVRLMMVDPKMVELAVYNGVPHLLSPVVTQMDKVVGVLQWAIREMERRYKLFADATVRNIQRYNEKFGAEGKRLPYIVLIVDELADLMLVSPEEVEDAVCRLAQLARAAGIHLVLATQRPSVDVVTGLIKANFPARIAFAMTSQVDSRTILDSAGAEKLLGRGDMLYLPPDAPKPTRLQGANVTDKEIERLVEFWHRSPLMEAIQRLSEEEFAAAAKASSDGRDELLDEAIRVVREHQHASVSLLQRRLKVGYSRAARLMDQLEECGVVGPADGSKQRPVLDDTPSFSG